MEKVKQKINDLLGEIIDPQIEITGDKLLITDCQLDSLKIMKLMSMIEDEFDLLIPVNKIMHIQSIDDLYNAVSEYLKVAA